MTAASTLCDPQSAVTRFTTMGCLLLNENGACSLETHGSPWLYASYKEPGKKYMGAAGIFALETLKRAPKIVQKPPKVEKVAPEIFQKVFMEPPQKKYIIFSLVQVYNLHVHMVYKCVHENLSLLHT